MYCDTETRAHAKHTKMGFYSATKNKMTSFPRKWNN